MTSASTKLLVMLMAGRRIGEVSTDRDGRLKLVYDDDWRVSDDATPVSLSMPLAQKAHDDPVRAFLWGLLPDSEQVLERWARTYHVSARNPFSLLRYVGEDCAGAVQFAEPDRVDTLLAGDGDV